MSDRTIKRALISVYDKTGLVDFAKKLVDEFGIEIISTGGTAKLLKESDIPVTLVEEVTGFPEMMDGRVKTLHPKIHAAILADRDNPEHMRQLKEQGIEPIDMVVVNLYPFKETIAKPDCKFEDAIEMIDIGGPCLLRAAAKNHKHVVVLPALDVAEGVVREWRASGDVSQEMRKTVAALTFQWTSQYDLCVSNFLFGDGGLLPSRLAIWLSNGAQTRYGENPGQEAAVYMQPDLINRECNLLIRHYSSLEEAEAVSEHSLEALSHSAENMSFNNYVDANAALELCSELSREPDSCGTGNEGGHRLKTGATCVFVKHTNACGVGVHADPLEAYRRAYLGDPSAAMGGILAANFEVDRPFAEAVMETYQRWGKDAGAGGFFIEVWLAPRFEDDAIETIRTAKAWGERIRLLDVGDMTAPADEADLEYRKITSGMLVQNRDLVGLNEDQWKIVTGRKPTESEMNDLRLAWLICKHTKSNAITVCKDNMLLGNGAGQMSRVMSCRIATWLAGDNGHADKLQGAVAASDAFFPFRDGPDLLMDAGVSAIIQPGGSKRDNNTIDACNERGVAMIFTGTRHFKH